MNVSGLKECMVISVHALIYATIDCTCIIEFNSLSWCCVISIDNCMHKKNTKKLCTSNRWIKELWTRLYRFIIWDKTSPYETITCTTSMLHMWWTQYTHTHTHNRRMYLFYFHKGLLEWQQIQPGLPLYSAEADPWLCHFQLSSVACTAANDPLHWPWFDI